MTSLAELLQQGAAYGWLFVPTAILLGALHGLEPGHSKSLMAAFIVAVHGTVKQAILLGLAATISHTAIVWIVALAGIYYGQANNMEVNEPYFQLASAVLILGIGCWMLVRIHTSLHTHHDHNHEGHEHSHDAHSLAHAQDIKKRFSGHRVTNGQIIVFGLTGGLIPCAAAITVLLLCLQLKQITLGAALVLSFSIGLALTLVASGVVAALGVHSSMRHFPWMASIMQKAPYLGGVITMIVGIYMAMEALTHIL